MAVTVVVLRVKLAVTGSKQAPDTQKTLTYLLDRAVPSDEELQQLFLQSLGKDPLRSTERRMLAADSSVVLTQMSKPEGAGHLPSALIFHDLPSSVKTTNTLSGTLGEDLSNVNQLVASVVDYRDFRQPSDVLSDAATALKYHQQFRETVKGPVFLVGIGGGSLPVLQAAVNSDLASDITGIILVNGYSSPKRAWEQLQVTDPIEARFYIQYFDCDAQPGVAAAELSPEERERITRCLNEYEVSGTVKDIPVLSIRTQNHAVATDALQETLKTFLSGADISESVVETADASGNIFVNATSPEFLKVRAVMSEWIETVSKAAVDTPTPEQPATNTNANTNTVAPIIVQ